MLKDRTLPLALLGLLCFAAYGPLLSLPLFEDDYPLISFADSQGFLGVVADPVFRPRATLSWMLLALWRTVHLTPAVYHAAGAGLHIVNSWLVYLLLLRLPHPLHKRAAFFAAAFFAVAEGHQEAVVWVAAASELFQFLFGAAALYCFLRAQQSDRPAPIIALGAIFFALALVSKESAIIWLPLFALCVPYENWRKIVPLVAPFVVLGLISVGLFVATGSNSFHYSDGSFSLHAPFARTWLRNFGRVLWIWGVAALALLWRYRRETELLRSAAFGLLWLGIGLIPYCFLTYSSQIPSRQTYLPSVGLAVLAGIALERLSRPPASRRLAAFVAALILAHNLGILWFRKRAQFAKRAEPTEQIIRLARQTPGPILVRCAPRNNLIFAEAVHVGAGRPNSDVLFTEAEAAKRPPGAIFCYDATSR